MGAERFDAPDGNTPEPLDELVVYGVPSVGEVSEEVEVCV